jgi:cytochrome P450
MYPEPPLLIRRALKDDVLPKGSGKFAAKIPRGADIFLTLYNIHRSPMYWENPDTFEPERFLRPYKNPEVGY